MWQMKYTCYKSSFKTNVVAINWYILVRVQPISEELHALNFDKNSSLNTYSMDQDIHTQTN